ncbi:tRNA synthetases class I-domain-containing protein [Paraphysoderma sedebokerense]|nr:tRNA synthetases class I-domain-containing protein [Paraphysoderma sedebokerense]
MTGSQPNTSNLPQKPEQEQQAAPSGDNENGSPKALSKNAAKNEAKKKAKMEKFLAKQAAMANKKPSAPSSGSSSPAPSKKEKPKSASNSTPEPEQQIPVVPLGEKKDMKAAMSSSYNPKVVESSWMAWWEKKGFMKAAVDVDANGKKVAKKEGTYVIPIPPPNVTDSYKVTSLPRVLTCQSNCRGHALTVSIQDAMTRYHRMHGKSTLYVPGCDHAGIATQSVVEKRIWKEKKMTRHDLGREEFLKQVWAWKEQYGGRIYGQLKRLGASCDFEKACFTMDPKLSKAVNEAFVTLRDEGIIYRANRLVNWCSYLNTALSNLEVESKELKGRTLMTVPGHDPNKKYEFGVLISFAYPVENSDEKIVVATTRIETMLGDTAVAVHPKDQRYAHLHGKHVIHPFNQRRIPIICDDYVDMNFGTGAVKITPAHDFNDCDIGKRHNLEFINIFNDDGTVNENGGVYQGLKRFDARIKVLADLKSRNLYIETKDNPMVVPMCSRSGDVIEPLMKPQWYVNCQDMAKQALDAVKNGDLEIVPKTSEKEWFRWLENIQDWCISRQLWWGHRIPAWLIEIKGRVCGPSDDEYWIAARSEDELWTKIQKKFPGIPKEDIKITQDPDVLDTWFSSGLWPFSIFGWPEKNDDLDIFYPTSLLETGWDILFFWVARMVMFGLKLTGKVPFKKVFCHAMVRDAHGRKMSKSLGNVIDPVDVMEGITIDGLHSRLEQGNLDPKEIEKAKVGQKQDYPKGIPECGADALRFALCAYTSTGRDINLNILRVEGYRKFCNKLWNATKFALMKLGEGYTPRDTMEPTGHESLVEKWILSKLNKAIREVNANFETMNFMNITNAVYNFWLYELCDVYIEAVKPIIIDSFFSNSSPTQAEIQASESAKATLYTCLDFGLKLLHPLMPFVTEELWQRLPRRKNDVVESIVISRFPVDKSEWEDEKSEKMFDMVMDAVKSVRSLMSDYGVQSGATAYATSSATTYPLLVSSVPTIVSLTKGLANFHILEPSAHIPAGCAVQAINNELSILLLVKGIVDIDGEIEKLEKKLKKAEHGKDGLKKKMSVEGYEEKVKEEVKEANLTKMKALDSEIELITKAIANFMKLKE